MARKLDDYQSPEFYRNRDKADADGFVRFEDDGRYYFARFAGDDLALISQSYTSKSGRDNGIKSVLKNAPLEERYRYEDRDGGLHGYALLAGNRQEIGVSPNLADPTAAQGLAGRMGGFAKAFTASDGRRGNYRPLAFYQDNGGQTSAGFDTFEHDGAHYFSYRRKGDILLISESYTSASGRDNGMASVEKNRVNPDRYTFRQHENGQHYFDLFAGNHQEIATSVWFDDAASAREAAAFLQGKSQADHDNYMPLAFYERQTTGTEDGFEAFKGEDGLHYFVYREDGRIALVSEGYPTTAAQKTGMASVEKNLPIESRYDFKQGGLDGKTGFRLRAGNNREIARSVAYGSAAAAAAGAAYLMGKRKRATAPVATGPAAAAGLAAGTLATAAATSGDPWDKMDDYLACDAYKGHPLTDETNRVAIFQHENGLHYFAFYQPDGDVRWRSEGFPSRAALQDELDVALRLHGNGEYIKRLERNGRYIDLLHDEHGREIARSCLCTIAPVAAAPVAAVAAAAAAGAAPLAAAAPVAASPPPADHGGAGVWGWLKWVLLALLALLAIWLLSRCFAGGDDGVAPVPAADDTASQAVVPPPVLVTCWDGSQAESEGACPASQICPDGTRIAAGATCAPAATDADGLSGMAVTDTETDAQTEAAISTPDPEPVLVTCWDGSQAEDFDSCPASVTCWDGSLAARQSECPPRPAPVQNRIETSAMDRTGLMPFFAAAPGATPKLVSYLGSNPEFGDSHDLTPAQFFDKLAGRHTNDAYDRQYLDALFRALGYDNGFADADASLFANATLASGTTGLLGFGSQHGIQYSTLTPQLDRDLEAFSVVGANGRTV